jgi:hypothetical protein
MKQTLRRVPDKDGTWLSIPGAELRPQLDAWAVWPVVGPLCQAARHKEQGLVSEPAEAMDASLPGTEYWLP